MKESKVEVKESDNDKTIEVTVRFWVNTVEVHEDSSKINKQACWDSGVVYMKVNPDLGVKHHSKMFEGINNILPAIQHCIKANKLLMVSRSA